MSPHVKPNVLSILQPDLLPVEELVRIIESRCCKAENLRLMSKEGLVRLFRRVVLPLPQRFYRTNRRGKMLTARRARAGLGSDRKEEGSCGRLKPPPDINRGQSGGVKDKRSLRPGEPEDSRKNAVNSLRESPSGRKIILKRPSSRAEKTSREAAPMEGKRQRTVIKWP